MLLFPAIDLVAGRVVRLSKGERSKMDVYSDDPRAVAEGFRDAGASWVHVVDLSAAFEEDEEAQAANKAAIETICSVRGLSVDAGGGVRSCESFERLLACGVSRVAVGTALVRDPDFAAEIARDYADVAVADIAARDGYVRVNGWREGSELSVDELVGRLSHLGYKHLVFTDIARDGMQTGIDAFAYAHVSELAGFPVVASGGVATLQDLRALKALGDDAIEAVICGRALYEGAFTLEDALAIVEGGTLC